MDKPELLELVLKCIEAEPELSDNGKYSPVLAPFDNNK